jgi:exonuclease III
MSKQHTEDRERNTAEAGETHTLRILQYNVNKSRNKVLAALLEDPEIKNYDIIAVQEPWRNPFDSQAYNPRQSGFHLIDKKSAESRVSIYVNKEISSNIWTETIHSPDLITVSIRLAGERNEIINIHNIYNPPPASHTEHRNKGTLIEIPEALSMPGAHIMVGDFNLHHPVWNAPSYRQQHSLADDLLTATRNAGLELALPPGTQC